MRASEPATERRSGGEVIRFAGPPGQVVVISVSHLVRLAERHGVDIEMLVRVGDGISTGTRIARLRGHLPDHRAIARGLLVQRERSLPHDPLYALRLLVDVAIRALSPAINDPTTAVRALDEIEGVLRDAAPLPLGPLAFEAGDGRLVLPAPTWPDVVDLALLEILEAGGDAPQITPRTTALLSDLLDDLPPERHEPLLRHRHRLAGQVSRPGPRPRPRDLARRRPAGPGWRPRRRERLTRTLERDEFVSSSLGTVVRCLCSGAGRPGRRRPPSPGGLR